VIVGETTHCRLDPVTGILAIDPPLEDSRGQIDRAELDPWGEDEVSMDRADDALATLGCRRTTPWSGAPGDERSCMIGLTEGE
jgi:hypothetical protein